MRPEDSPFPAYWWGTNLANYELESVRPNVGTYGRYDYSQLPPLPFELHGNLDWLESAALHDDWTVDERKLEHNVKALASLRDSAKGIDVSLPQEFVRFMGSVPLQKRIRSASACFLDLCPALIRSPIDDGYLVRFLADQQGCVFWYLYLTRGGAHHSVVSSPGFYGTDEEEWQDSAPDPADIVFAAESFEAFLCRFWIENEIFFANTDGTPMPDIGREYIGRYRGEQ